MRYTFTAVYLDGGDGQIAAYIEELPGVLGQGRTVEDARVSLRQALDFALACNRSDTRKAFHDARVIRRERMTT
jgi:predicted RNase H-like HicB family nuclease